MAQRTINSPGVEIRESDLSFTAPAAGGTSVYITGFAQQGPIDEVLLISTKQELVQIFGPPTNAAERYFHYSISELLNSPAAIYAGRLPYGSGAGDGFGSKYTALAYPVSSYAVYSGAAELHDTLASSSSATILVGAPTHVELTEAQYLAVTDGSAVTWTNCAARAAAASASATTLGNAGIVVLNKTQVANNQQQEGFYVGLIGNVSQNPASNFDSITGVNGLYAAATSTAPTALTQIPQNNLAFPLSSTATTGSEESLSRVMENLVDYDIGTADFDDYLSLGVFKLRRSLYANEATKLDYVLKDTAVGSINFHRKEFNKAGGANKSAFIGVVSKDAPNTTILINDNLSKRLVGATGLNAQNTPQIKIRTLGDLRTATANQMQLSGDICNQPAGFIAAAKSGPNTADLFPLGQFTNEKVTTKILGDVPSKIK